MKFMLGALLLCSANLVLAQAQQQGNPAQQGDQVQTPDQAQQNPAQLQPVADQDTTQEDGKTDHPAQQAGKDEGKGDGKDPAQESPQQYAWSVTMWDDSTGDSYSLVSAEITQARNTLRGYFASRDGQGEDPDEALQNRLELGARVSAVNDLLSFNVTARTGDDSFNNGFDQISGGDEQTFRLRVRQFFFQLGNEDTPFSVAAGSVGISQGAAITDGFGPDDKVGSLGSGEVTPSEEGITTGYRARVNLASVGKMGDIGKYINAIETTVGRIDLSGAENDFYNPELMNLLEGDLYINVLVDLTLIPDRVKASLGYTNLEGQENANVAVRVKATDLIHVLGQANLDLENFDQNAYSVGIAALLFSPDLKVEVLGTYVNSGFQYAQNTNYYTADLGPGYQARAHVSYYFGYGFGVGAAVGKQFKDTASDEGWIGDVTFTWDLLKFVEEHCKKKLRMSYDLVPVKKG